MDGVASLVDEWFCLDERAIFQAASKNIALHLEEGLGRALWEDVDDNYALVSDSSDYPPTSSLLDVAGIFAEWLSLAERLNFQSVSHIVSFQLRVEFARLVLDNF